MEFLAFLLVAVVVFLLLRGRRKKRPVVWGRPEIRPGGTISGKAYVTDGDGVRVSGYEIRLAGLDAPEWDQRARHRDGYWFNQGKRIKSALIEEVGGKDVDVAVVKFDKYGRAVGGVTCDGKDIGEWLVRNGHAIAAYGGRYEAVEWEARAEERGMWGCAIVYDPRGWRHGKKKRLF